MTQHWPFPLVMVVLGLVVFGIWTFVIAIPSPNQDACDRLFVEFMTTKDPVIVNRNGWLLYKLSCDVSRRYRKFPR